MSFQAATELDMPRDLLRKAAGEVHGIDGTPALTLQEVDAASEIVGQMGSSAFQRGLAAVVDVLTRASRMARKICGGGSVAPCATLRKRVTTSYPRGQAINKAYRSRQRGLGSQPCFRRVLLVMPPQDDHEC
jgi:hypothetical protein